MEDWNRILILILLAVLIYALYRYQEQIKNLNLFGKRDQGINSTKKIPRKKTNKSRNKSRNKKTKDDISIGNISQVSLGSLADVKSEPIYKPDSVLNSIDSVPTLGSLIDVESDDFFFQ